jgi:hypothetical protein
MNANELADKLDWINRGEKTLDEAATMLRQQQAEIESLKKQVLGDNYVFVCKRCAEEMGINFEEEK